MQTKKSTITKTCPKYANKLLDFHNNVSLSGKLDLTSVCSCKIISCLCGTIDLGELCILGQLAKSTSSLSRYNKVRWGGPLNQPTNQPLFHQNQFVFFELIPNKLYCFVCVLCISSQNCDVTITCLTCCVDMFCCQPPPLRYLSAI